MPETPQMNFGETRPCVAVLMSTYNGESFLREQIDSILAQEGVDVDLFIRDDGSGDSTLDAIGKYVTKCPNVFLLTDEAGSLGPGMGFMLLLCAVADGACGRYDYYAFADQDDIWLPDKLQEAAALMGKAGAPRLYCSNQYLYYGGDANPANLALRHGRAPDCTLKGHLNRNELSGCTMVMNAALARLIAEVPLPPKEILDYRMHDAWVFLVAVALGTVYYDGRSFILYRIHEANAVGVRGTTTRDRVERVLSPSGGKAKYGNIRMKTAQALVERYPELESVDCIAEFARYQRSWKGKWRLMRDTENCQYTGESPVAFALKVLVNFV